MWEDDSVADEGFYEEDEPIEDLRAAWKAGEPGTTSGPRDLNQRAASIIARAVARFEERETVHLQVVSSGTTVTTDFPKPDVPVPAVDQVQNKAVSATEYQVV